MASENVFETTPVNDSSPLLPDQHALEAQKSKPRITPLPKAQLATLCSVRLVDPISFTQIFPYINEFMNDLHVTDDPSRIGFYSGVVESAFAIAQVASIYQWTRFSDVIGRRPAILAGITGIVISTMLFGLSRSLVSVIAMRFFVGLFSGTIAVVHSVLGELTDSTNQAVAVPIYGLIYPLGCIIGPMIGGTFSNPATKFPEYFDSGFFRTFPYFLPCFMSAMLALTGALCCYFFLEETSPKIRRSRLEKSSSRSSSRSTSVSYSTGNASSTASIASVETPSARELLTIPSIYALCTSGFALSFISMSFDDVFVLFCYSPVQSGGLEFSALRIGYSLAIAGCISSSIQLLFMPTLLRTFDNAKMYSFCMSIWPFAFIGLPILNVIARNGLDERTGLIADHHLAVIWVGIAIVLTLGRIAVLGYTVNLILVKEKSPNPEALGASNGLVQFSMCLARAFAPAFVSSCFALSIENNLLGGHLWVVVMVIISYFGRSLTKNITKGSKMSGR